MQSEGQPISAAAEPGPVDRWILSRLDRMTAEVHGHLADFRLDLAAQALYEFVWNEYCDWYLEFTKPTLQGDDEHARAATRHTLLSVLETTLRCLHPLVPFITEEIWQRVRPALGIEGETIMLQPWPHNADAGNRIDDAIEQDINWLKDAIQGVRRIRSELNIYPGKPLDIWLQGGSDSDRERLRNHQTVFNPLARAQSCQWVDETTDTSQCAVALLGDLKILVPLAGLIDITAELSRLRKQLETENRHVQTCQAKLSNKRFVENAPAEVVEQERQRLQEHQTLLASLKDQLEKLEAMQ
jgi:valyl-tRNA synthetase